MCLWVDLQNMGVIYLYKGAEIHDSLMKPILWVFLKCLQVDIPNMGLFTCIKVLKLVIAQWN